MELWLFRLTVSILDLRQTVKFLSLRLTEVFKINYNCFEKLNINFHCS